MDAKIPSSPPDAADTGTIAATLLAWYDVHARTLPWRTGADEGPDPYRVWLSEVMLQQTTVATVTPRFAAFVARWPTVEALARADDAELMSAWAGLGYYARARNLIACARAVVADHGGTFPADEAALRQLPGVGAYTAAAISAIAFGRRAVVVDANVERVVARLFAIETPLPAARPAIRTRCDAITPNARAGDFAQAMMDLGATICTPRAPACDRCPIRPHCRAAAEGAPERHPVKPPKLAKPVRFGTVFWLERDGSVLLVRRPPRGLLGGMRALPTGPWDAGQPGLAEAPVPNVDWRLMPGTVSHGFTHFRLELVLAVADGARHSAAVPGEWWAIDALDSAGLPTVFAKAAALRSE